MRYLVEWINTRDITRRLVLQKKVKDFIHSLDGPMCVKEIKEPVISKEDYFNKMDILVDYTFNDAGSLTTYRPSNKELLRKIFEYAWDGKEIDF